MGPAGRWKIEETCNERDIHLLTKSERGLSAEASAPGQAGGGDTVSV